MKTSYAFVDRCGKGTWTGGGGTGLLIAKEVTNTISTLASFNSVVFVSPTRSIKCNEERILCAKRHK